MSKIAEALETIRYLIGTKRASETSTALEREAWQELCAVLPWRCLHCGSVFVDEDEAQEHARQIAAVGPDVSWRESVLLLDAVASQLEVVNELLHTRADRFVYGLPCSCAELSNARFAAHDGQCSKIRSLIVRNKELVAQAVKIARKPEIEVLE